MNAELAALLRAAKETPDDDAPRSVIADWLDEHGEPERAELLRLLSHPDYRWHHQGAALRARADELIAANGERWGSLAEMGVRSFLKRGFLTVHIPFRVLHDGLAACSLRDAWEQGWVDTLNVDLWNSPFADPWPFLAACPLLTGMSDLSLTGLILDDHAAAYLTRSPNLESLVSFAANVQGLTPAGLSLFESPNLPRLARFNGSTDGPRIVAALREAATTGVLRLEGIRPSAILEGMLRRVIDPITEASAVNISLGRAELRALLAVPGLRRLLVQDSRLRGHMVSTIAKHAPPTLTELRLPTSRINNGGCVALGDAVRLVGLRLLDLAGNIRITEMGVIVLARSPHLAGLRALDLRDTPLSTEAVVTLTRSETFPQMRRIVLSEVGLNPTRRASLLARYGDALTLVSPGSAHPAIELPEDAP